MSVPTAASSTSPLASARADLESDDPRRRLAALGDLSRLVCGSKSNQHAVGAFLRDASNGRRLLEVIVSDLRASDRSLRCAAARLVCELAYENLVNQEAIMQLTRGGFSLGWLHVFCVPEAFRAAYNTQDASHSQPSQRGLTAFLHELVADAFDEIYHQVSQYYAGGCKSFLPLSWQFPRRERLPTNPVEADQDVPDPADHVVGFFLVPRQTQFPESDAFYLDELLKSLDPNDLLRFQSVQSAADEYASMERDWIDVDAFIADCYASANETKPLHWLVGEDLNTTVASLREYFADPTKSSSLTWNSVFVYACMKLNSEKLAQTFETATLQTVAKLFRELAFTPGDSIRSNTMVWLPVLVTAIQFDPELPLAFKRQMQSLHRSAAPAQAKREPWRVLLHTPLEQVVPVSWAVLLAQWRVVFELDQQLQLQLASSAPVRRTSVCSVGDLRRSLVAQMQPHSFRDLNQLRRELPRATKCASHQDLASSSSSLSSFRERVPVGQTGANGDESDESEDDEVGDALTRDLALFHRMQRSLAELDTLGMQNLQEKQKEKLRVQQTVAMNKQRAQDEATQRRLQVDEKHREIDEQRAELERRKALARAKTHEQQQLKHALAAQRKQQHDAEQQAKQHELAHKIEERDRKQQLNMRRRQQEFEQERRGEQQQRRAPRPPTDACKRPQSARGPRPTTAAATTSSSSEIPSPEILRQRALLYGKVVSKIYVAEAANRSSRGMTPAPLHHPHQLTRSFSVYRDGGFNVKAPVVKLAPPASRRSRSPRSHRRSRSRSDVSEDGENEGHEIEVENEAPLTPSRIAGRTKLHSHIEKVSAETPTTSPMVQPPGHANACATLVMRNAALAVSERLLIPDVPAPHVEEPVVPPFVIAAQYEALDDTHKRNFRARFNLKTVSHRLSYDVLKHYTKIVRRDMAWQAFHDRCGQSERVKYMDFAAIAQLLGVVLSEKQLLVVARQLDPKKSGFVEWKAFYTWWSMQYSDPQSPAPTRPKTTR